jgi:hypothetical protein
LQKVTGARSGHIEGDDLVLDLALPKVFGGKHAPGKTNPEELFAAGYGRMPMSILAGSPTKCTVVSTMLSSGFDGILIFNIAADPFIAEGQRIGQGSG